MMNNENVLYWISAVIWFLAGFVWGWNSAL